MPSIVSSIFVLTSPKGSFVCSSSCRAILFGLFCESVVFHSLNVFSSIFFCLLCLWRYLGSSSFVVCLRFYICLVRCSHRLSLKCHLFGAHFCIVFFMSGLISTAYVLMGRTTILELYCLLTYLYLAPLNV